MESFACLIQTHTRQDEEGTRERKRERDGKRGGDLQKKTERIEEEKHKVQERDY